MKPYNDIYEPVNWTRLILLIVLMCTSVFYYSTQLFIVEASDISTGVDRYEIFKQVGLIEDQAGIDGKSKNEDGTDGKNVLDDKGVE